MPAVTANPDQVVAEVAGKPITLKDVDAKWEEFDAAERARIIQAMYQNRRNMLDQIVGDRLIENAAKAAGQTVEAFVAADSVKRLPAISEADIAQFYEQNKDRAQGRTLEQLRGEIKPFLEARREQQARAMLVEELKAKNAGAVKVMLEAPRYTVATLDDDPVRGNAAAPITIVEFSDYQCPFCARVNPTLEKVRETYGDKVRIVFKDYPLPNHPRGAEGVGGGALRRRAEEVLGDARRDVRQPARAGSAGAEADRAGDRPRWRGVRSVPGFRQARRRRPRRLRSSASGWA